MGACLSSTATREDVRAPLETEAEDQSEWAKYGGKELELPIEKGWVRVLDSQYLVDLARRSGVIGKRQDMPDDAYLGLNQLKDLGVRTKDIGEVIRKDEQTWLPLVILSYPWLTPAHPDPHGETLAKVAEALEKLRSPHGVIIDFTALPQVPRKPSEEDTFRSGLKSLNLFYTHPYVIVFKVTEFPADYPDTTKYGLGEDFVPVKYDQRGWCYAESCMAGLGSKPKLVCDISHLNKNVLGSGATETPPPLSPEAFNLALQSKTFTQAKTDTERVKKLYLSAFDLRIKTAKALRFADLGWKGAEVKELAEVIETSSQAEQLILSYNDLDVYGAKVVAQVVRTHHLRVLELRGCGLCDGGAAEIAEVLKLNTTLITLHLQSSQILAEGGRRIGEALKLNTTLKELNLEHNKIKDEGGKGIREGLKVNTALTTLILGSDDIGAEGAKAIGEGLKQNAALTELDLQRNRIGEEGGKGIGEGLKLNTALTTLNLYSNLNIGNDGAKGIGEALKVNTALTTLNLSTNDLTDSGVRGIREAAGPHVTVIW